LHRSEGMPIKAIARVMGAGRNTVRRALESDGPPKYRRASRGSLVDAVEPQIRELLRAWPIMSATVIAERIGWLHSLTILKDRCASCGRCICRRTRPDARSMWPGELAQCDPWFPPADIPLGHGQQRRPPVLVMVCGYSRVIAAVMLPSRQSADLPAGHWELLCGWGRVPRALLWDNESAVGKWRAGKPEPTTAMNAFRGMLGIKVLLCRPGDPEAKGLVERANGYLETSFLPGRTFRSPDDFNAQLSDWLAGANTRKHPSLGCRPMDRWPTQHETRRGCSRGLSS
jgi:transposase